MYTAADNTQGRKRGGLDRVEDVATSKLEPLLMVFCQYIACRWSRSLGRGETEKKKNSVWLIRTEEEEESFAQHASRCRRRFSLSREERSSVIGAQAGCAAGLACARPRAF